MGFHWLFYVGLCNRTHWFFFGRGGAHPGVSQSYYSPVQQRLQWTSELVPAADSDSSVLPSSVTCAWKTRRSVSKHSKQLLEVTPTAVYSTENQIMQPGLEAGQHGMPALRRPSGKHTLCHFFLCHEIVTR